MATAKVTVDREEEDTMEVIDNTLKLRSRQVERPETDPSQRTQIGMWSARSTSEPRASERGYGMLGEKERAKLVSIAGVSGKTGVESLYDTSEIRSAREMDEQEDVCGFGEDPRPPTAPLLPPNYQTAPSEQVMMHALSDIAQLLRQNQRSVPSAKSISDSVIGLRKFSGSANDRDAVESWLDEFLRYSDFRSLSAAERLQLFKILMSGTAADWLATLSANKTSNFDVLVREFKATYFRSAELRWHDASNLFNVPMKESERVDDFIVRIRKAAKRLNVGDEIIQYCFIAGLLPSLREKVLAKGVTSLEETLKMARIAECCTQADPVNKLLLDVLNM